MDANTTKQAFANVYERVLKRVLRKEKLNRKTEMEVRKLVANLVMVAWNRCIASSSLTEAKNEVVAYANQNYGGQEKIRMLLLNAVSIKWHDYGDDTTFIPCVAVGEEDGKPTVSAKLEDELPKNPIDPAAFRKHMESPEIRKRLSHVGIENLDEEIEKIKAEFNASLPPDNPQKYNNFRPEFFKVPLSRAALEDMHERTLQHIPTENKNKLMEKVLKEQPFLAHLCREYKEAFTVTELARQLPKDQRGPGSIPDLILSIYAAFSSTVDFTCLREESVKSWYKVADKVVSTFMENNSWFYDSGKTLDEQNLVEFIVENVVKTVASLDERAETMKVLLAWGMVIGEARKRMGGAHQ